MQATATTVSTRGSIGRILVLGTGALMAFLLGAAIALAATGWFATDAVSAVPTFDATDALRTHVLRENGATAGPAVINDALYEHVMRENGGR